MSFSLAHGGTTVTLSPLSSTQPDHTIDTGAVTKTSLNGTLFAYTKYAKVNHRFEVNDVSKADADFINGWCQNKDILTYTDEASATHSVILINEVNPLSWMPGTAADSKFSGSLMIREV